MQKLPVFQVIREAFDFIFTKYKNILPVFGQYTTVMILVYVILHLMKDHLDYSSNGSMPAFTIAVILLSTIFILFLQVPLNILILRFVAKQEAIRKDYFNTILAPTTRKTVLTTLLVLTIIASGAILITAGFSLLLTGLASLLPPKFEESLGILSSFIPIFLASLPIIYMVGRLFLAVPCAALEQARPIRHAWAISKGNVARLFAVVLLTSIPSVIWSQIITYVFNITAFSNPLAYGLLSLPNLYLGLLVYAGLGQAYKYINK